MLFFAPDVSEPWFRLPVVACSPLIRTLSPFFGTLSKPSVMSWLCPPALGCSSSCAAATAKCTGWTARCSSP